jgi:hypothetical protein
MQIFPGGILAHLGFGRSLGHGLFLLIQLHECPHLSICDHCVILLLIEE